MVKAIKLRTKAQTPAEPSERKTGSKRNPKGSASGSRGGIEIGAQALKALENARDKHNAKYTKKSRRVDLGTLKAVFRRGAGAFSVSHRPGMTRNQWALARVNTFLKLVGTGQRKKAYNTDLDLLPKGHPQRTEAEAKAETLAPKRYSHIDFTPPQGVRDAGRRALEVRASKPPSERGMTDVGVARARDLANGRELSPDTVRRMLNFLIRHEVDKQGSTWDQQGKGWQAWHGWGGDAGFAWSRKIVKQMDAADKKAQALRAYSEALNVSYDIPDGLTLGRPFKTLSLGQVSSRMNGENVGKEINETMLSEMIRVFKERRQEDPVIIDWQHATSPYQSGPPAPPESGNALGLIVDLELREDGLYAYPAYNERGLNVVNEAGGVLWSSPEFLAGEVFDRAGGDKVGDAQLLAITLTPRPAQSHAKIDRVILNERLEMENVESMTVEDLRAMLIAKDEMVKELESKIKEMKQDSESSMMESKSKDDEDEKLAESKDHDEKKEKNYKMSETTVEPTLLSEINALRESNNALKKSNSDLQERIEKVEADKLEVEKREAVTNLLRDGRITPAEESLAGKAWMDREKDAELWNYFSERPSASAVPLAEVGHGASGREITRQSLDGEVRKLASEKSITYSEALITFRAQNPEYYNQAFGG